MFPIIFRFLTIITYIYEFYTASESLALNQIENVDISDDYSIESFE